MRFYLLLIFLNHLFPLIVSNGVAPKVASSKPFTAFKTFGSKVASSKPFTVFKTFGSKVATSKPFTVFKTFGSKVASSKPFTAVKTFWSKAGGTVAQNPSLSGRSAASASGPSTAPNILSASVSSPLSARSHSATEIGSPKALTDTALHLQSRFPNVPTPKLIEVAQLYPGLNALAESHITSLGMNKPTTSSAVGAKSPFQGMKDGFSSFKSRFSSARGASGTVAQNPSLSGGSAASASGPSAAPPGQTQSTSSASGTVAQNPSLSGRSASSVSGASSAPLERSPSIRSATSSSQDLNRLNKMFPNHDVALVRDALHSSGNNINGAANFLRQMPPAFGGAAPTQSTSSASGTVAQNPSLSGGSAASVSGASSVSLDQSRLTSSASGTLARNPSLSGGSVASASGASSAPLERPLAASKGIDVKGKGPANFENSPVIAKPESQKIRLEDVKDQLPSDFWSRPGPSNDQLRLEQFFATAR